MKKILKNNRGFTLVEIIVVLAILAMLIAVGMPSLQGLLREAKIKTALLDASNAKIAIEIKMLENLDLTDFDTVLNLIDRTDDRDDIAILVATNNENTANKNPTEIFGIAYRDVERMPPVPVTPHGNNIPGLVYPWIIIVLNKDGENTSSIGYFEARSTRTHDYGNFVEILPSTPDQIAAAAIDPNSGVNEAQGGLLDALAGGSDSPPPHDFSDKNTQLLQDGVINSIR